MSDSESSSTQDYSDDSQECYVESMEAIITQLNEEIDKLSMKLKTFQSILISDILEV